MAQITINNGDTGLTVRNALNFMFTELYGLPSLGISTGQITNWDEAYSWGNHAGLYDTIGTADSVINDHLNAFNHDLIATALQSESDPVFSSSAAAGITSTDITNWNAAMGLAGASWQKVGNTLTATGFLGSLNAYLVQIGANSQVQLEFQTTNKIKFLTGQAWYPSADGTNVCGLYQADSTTQIIKIDTSNKRIAINPIDSTSPNSNLTIMGANIIQDAAMYSFNSVGNSAFNSGNAGSGWAFGGYYSASLYAYVLGGIKGIKENTTSGDYASALCLITRVNGGVPTENWRLTSEGNTSMRTAKYNYLDTSATADTLNDIRISNQSGVFTVEKCTVANATKGAGTWTTILTA